MLFNYYLSEVRHRMSVNSNSTPVQSSMNDNYIIKFMINLVSGFVAATVAMYFTHPIDTLKIQYQADKQSRRVPELIKTIYQTQGFRGFYQGCGSTLPTYPVFWGIFFSVRNQNWILCQNTLLNSILNNFMAASVASTVCNPLFVLKTRKQTSVMKNAKLRCSYFDEIRTIYQTEGLRGFGRGLGITLWSNLRLVVQFPLYDWIMLRSVQNILLASVISKSVANSVFYPTNIIGTIQRDRPIKISVGTIYQQIYHVSGWRGFYKGLLIYNMASCPNFAIMMLVKEWLDKRIGFKN
jgi:solute carrier family 25 folate transporter 32